MNILLLMVKSISLGNSNSLHMSPKRKKQYAEILHLNTYRSITNALSNMCKANIIKKVRPDERFDSEYQINPEILFSGNDYQRARIIIEYSSGKRNITVETKAKGLLLGIIERND